MLTGEEKRTFVDANTGPGEETRSKQERKQQKTELPGEHFQRIPKESREKLARTPSTPGGRDKPRVLGAQNSWRTGAERIAS